MEQAHRRVELQSPSDLQYLIANASQAARRKIDLHFPPNPLAESVGVRIDGPSDAQSATEDPMRRRVEELVQVFIEETFKGVRQNISINGLEGAEMDALLKDAGADGQETEAFDTNLAKKMQHVSTNIEILQLQLADLRRTAPARTAARFTADLNAQEEKRQLHAVTAEEQAVERAVESVQLNVTGLDQVQDMRRSWEEGTKTLAKLGDTIGSTVGQVEQARTGLNYLQNA